jgi:hypothetical protein
LASLAALARKRFDGSKVGSTGLATMRRHTVQGCATFDPLPSSRNYLLDMEIRFGMEPAYEAK